jgi:hypothetical protein
MRRFLHIKCHLTYPRHIRRRSNLITFLRKKGASYGPGNMVYIYMPNTGTNVAGMLAFTLISKDSLPQKTPVLNSQLIHQETIMTV